MKRTLKFSLSLGNTNKTQKIDALFEEYKKAVNFYLRILSSEEKYILSSKELKSSELPLTYRFKQCAARQATKIWKTWRRNKKKGNLPEFRQTMILDQRFIKIEKAENSFDYWVKIACLIKSYPVRIPFKSYKYANDYFETWKLVNGGRLKKEDKTWFLLLTFDLDTPEKKTVGNVIGADIGIKKLVATSEGKEYGKDIERLMDKIQRKEQGSKGFKRALKERDYYVNKVAKELPYEEISAVVMENIKGIKKNTKKDRRLRKEFRSKFQRWTYRPLVNRISQLSELSGVHFHLVDPAYTSQRCSKCNVVHKLNRDGELFLCKNCGYMADADFNASKNVLGLYLARQSMVAGSA